MPIINAGQTEGAVRLTQSVEAIDRETRRDQYALIGVGALALVFGLVVAWFVAGSLARPLRELASTARRVGGGDLDVRAEVEGSAEQKEVAQAFNTMTDRLTHSLDAQREFVANASHQLRTPLTGLRLRVEAASMATDDPVVRQELAAAEAETVRLARLITNLLTLASADAPAQPSEPVDFAAAAREAEERCADAPRAKAAGSRSHPSATRRASAAPTTSRRSGQPDREHARACAGGQHRRDLLGPRRRRGLHRSARRRPRHRPGGRRGRLPALPARRGAAGRAWRHRPGAGDRGSADHPLGRLGLAPAAQRGRHAAEIRLPAPPDGNAPVTVP